ncbi:hypothetical protein DESAMIL20_300 [Desulfurella amilsii]|uniref:Uncharacterized protein n=1 Tax=Desulfurella amilsii TaxID=1562698 RepID=A0A1X4XZA8_9BACT|nr:hypothetical protein [Desulfurella amilsii]OSS42870.1 hypothetical protein DESAMIL20_300 [Desulfurella amilsii]
MSAKPETPRSSTALSEDKGGDFRGEGLNKKTIALSLIFALSASSAFALNPTSFCENFAKNTLKSFSVEKAKEYLYQHPNDFTANFCFGEIYSWQKRPYTTAENNIKQNAYPIGFYNKAAQLTTNPAYKVMAYLEMAYYYANNNGYPATAESKALTQQYLNLALQNALKSNDKELMQNTLLKLVFYGDPLKIDEYILAGQRFFTSDKDKLVFYDALANRFDSVKDYKKALYYRVQALDLKFKMKMFFDLTDISNLQCDIFKANDYNLTQEAITKLITIAEYLQANGNKVEKFNGYPFTYNYYAGNIYDDLGNILSKLNRYDQALNHYKVAYALYIKAKEPDRAKQELLKIKKTEDAIKASQKTPL